VPVAVAIGACIGVAALLFMAAGSGPTMVLVALIVGAAAAEFYTTIRRAGHRPAQLLGLTACVALPLAAYWKGESAFPLVLFLSILFLFLWYLVGAGDEQPTAGMGVTLLGIGWIGGLGAFAALLLRAPDGVSLLLAIALAAVAYDVGAFFVGRSIGQSPLSAASPHKTWEGVGGGALAAVVVSLVVAGWYPGLADGLFGGEYWNSILLGLVIAVAGTIGDLSESVLKRDLGVKDMGSIIPGHGGVLDRFDGILFALPAGYYLVHVLA
jgi:phosphatidate cytidylyltransferase